MLIINSVSIRDTSTPKCLDSSVKAGKYLVLIATNSIYENFSGEPSSVFFVTKMLLRSPFCNLNSPYIVQVEMQLFQIK